MKILPIYPKLFLTTIFLIGLGNAIIGAQADTVLVNDINVLPLIDGLGDDECWSIADWQTIDQVWINYGEELDSTDFSGRFKIVWSSETNLLYYLIEVTDDTFIDGWPDIAGDYFAFDIIEVFIDQDRSGGLHVFDGTGSIGDQWGTNAENAFSYHINIDLPADSEYSSRCVVNDIAGTNWSDVWNPDYSKHFPEIALREHDGKYYWEFSLIVYNDTYYHPFPDSSRVFLQEGDIMGMSIAYCDNDGIDEDPKTRDNFIGSVWVPEEAYNDHWMNADDYGVIKLMGNKNEPLVQDDPVEAIETEVVPVIDGEYTDEIWSKAEWQPISQVWINYGEEIDPEDFSGRYKVSWSSETDLLYFLVEITDDIFVDGYQYNSDPSIGGGYPNYDIVEVFIDQDRSGGLHVFDGTGNTGVQWGTNAENAFSYHIAVDLLPDSQTVTDAVICDIAGTDWGNYYIPDYRDHFPEFALGIIEDKYYWEFSMAVYDDTYDPNIPEASWVGLKADDIMGLTLAYCDNDGIDEDPKTRDNFIGSVWVPEDEYNDHWMNADGFGTIKLTSDLTGIEENEIVDDFILRNNYPNPFNPSTTIKYSIPFSYWREGVFVSLNIYDILGQEISALVSQIQKPGSYEVVFNASHLPSGVYFYMLKAGNNSSVKKMTLLK